jgi:hypothetical protein
MPPCRLRKHAGLQTAWVQQCKACFGVTDRQNAKTMNLNWAKLLISVNLEMSSHLAAKEILAVFLSVRVFSLHNFSSSLSVLSSWNQLDQCPIFSIVLHFSKTSLCIFHILSLPSEFCIACSYVVIFYFIFFRAEDETKGHAYTRQNRHHWAALHPLQFSFANYLFAL